MNKFKYLFNYENIDSSENISSARKQMEFVKNEIILKNNIDFHIKYRNIKNIIEDFIIKKNLLLYGGTAINISLPIKKQFYNKSNSKPDYDVFSVNPKEDIIELANILYKKTKMKYINAYNGIHDGTYKLKYDNYSFVDITYLNKEDFTRFLLLTQLKSKRNLLGINPNIKLVPLEVLRYSFHLEFAKPFSSSHRWDKLYDRIKIFDNHNIPSKTKLIKYIKKNNKNIINCTDINIIKILDFLINLDLIKNLPLIGTYAIVQYLQHINLEKNNNNKIYELLINKFTKYNIINNDVEDDKLIIPYLSIISTKPLITANRIVEYLNIFITSLLNNIKYNLTIDEVILNNSDKNLDDENKLKRYSIILCNYNNTNIPLIEIFSVNACYTTYKINKNLFGSIDTILAYKYNSIIHFDPIKNYKKDNINLLLANLLAYLINKKNIKRYFGIECYGQELSFHAIKNKQISNKMLKFNYIPYDKFNKK